jgi:hypothetical protein
MSTVQELDPRVDPAMHFATHWLCFGKLFWAQGQFNPVRLKFPLCLSSDIHVQYQPPNLLLMMGTAVCYCCFFVSVFPHVLPILTLSLYDCNFRSPPRVSSVFWFKRSILACQPETKTRFPTQDPLVPRDLEEHVPMPYRQK